MTMGKAKKGIVLFGEDLTAHCKLHVDKLAFQARKNY